MTQLKNPKKRMEICRDNIYLFSLYYFTDYHKYDTPDFHMDMYDDLEYRDWQYVVWVMFRESAKTSIAKIKLIHNIAYKKKLFNIWVSFDEKKAESNLFDVALQLQTNSKLIQDFGQLFFNKEKELEMSQKKSIGEFITTNGVKVKAYSTGMSTRGEVFGAERPDAYFIDDIETLKTINSIARTEQVKSFLDELFSGVATDVQVLIMGNKLINNGSIQYVEDRAKGNKNWRHKNIPLYENDTLAWPSKYVWTNEERDRINATIEDPKLRVVSVEQKRLDLGQVVFNREMLNKPMSDETREFQWKWLEQTFNESEIKLKAKNRFAAIDANQGSIDNSGDPLGVTIVDWDLANNWYIQYAKRHYINLPQLIDLIFFIWTTYKPIKIGVEKLAFKYQVEPYLRQRSDETGIYPVVVELKHGGRNKHDRIRGALQGRAQAGKLWFKEGATDDQGELRMELFDFPRAQFDDLSDSLSYIDQIGYKPFGKEDESPPTTLAEEMIQHRNQMAGAKAGFLDELM